MQNVFSYANTYEDAGIDVTVSYLNEKERAQTPHE